MNSPSGIDPFLEPLAALQNLIDRLDGQGLIMGGIAASLLGRRRLTADLGAMVLASTQDIPDILSIAQDVGLTPRIHQADEFARSNRVLLLEHHETGIPVDIALGVLPVTPFLTYIFRSLRTFIRNRLDCCVSPVSRRDRYTSVTIKWN